MLLLHSSVFSFPLLIDLLYLLSLLPSSPISPLLSPLIPPLPSHPLPTLISHLVPPLPLSSLLSHIIPHLPPHPSSFLSFFLSPLILHPPSPELASRAPISCIRCHKLRTSDRFKCGRCGDIYLTKAVMTSGEGGGEEAALSQLSAWKRKKEARDSQENNSGAAVTLQGDSESSGMFVIVAWCQNIQCSPEQMWSSPI